MRSVMHSRIIHAGHFASHQGRIYWRWQPMIFRPKINIPESINITHIVNWLVILCYIIVTFIGNDSRYICRPKLILMKVHKYYKHCIFTGVNATKTYMLIIITYNVKDMLHPWRQYFFCKENIKQNHKMHEGSYDHVIRRSIINAKFCTNFASTNSLLPRLRIACFRDHE